MIELTLFYREGCHLCEQMLLELVPYLDNDNIVLKRIDIDENTEYLSQYHDLVPVLHVNEDPICKYQLDHSRLKAYLSI